MTIEQIRYFLKVVECGSFTRAAEECDISQPAISQYVKLLEGKIGVQLLKRGHRTFELTEAGQYFYKNCRAILDSLDETISMTQAISEKRPVEIHAGLPRAYSDAVCAEAISRFSEAHPNVLVKITKRNYEELTSGLIERSFDLVINERRKTLRNFYYVEELISVPLYIAVSPKSPLAGEEFIDTEEMGELTCVAVASGRQKAAEKNFINNDLGFQGKICFSRTLDKAVMQVAQNQGFAFIDGMQGMNLPEPLIALRPARFKGQPLCRIYSALWKKNNLTHLIRQFVDVLKDTISARG